MCNGRQETNHVRFRFGAEDGHVPGESPNVTEGRRGCHGWRLTVSYPGALGELLRFPGPPIFPNRLALILNRRDFPELFGSMGKIPEFKSSNPLTRFPNNVIRKFEAGAAGCRSWNRPVEEVENEILFLLSQLIGNEITIDEMSKVGGRMGNAGTSSFPPRSRSESESSKASARGEISFGLRELPTDVAPFGVSDYFERGL